MALGALYQPRRIKPAGFVRVNHAHPMARWLAALLITPSGGQNGTVNATLYDAVTGSPAGRASGQSTVATSEGPALRFAGTTRSSTTTAMRPFGVGTYDPRLNTIIARLRLRTKAASGNGGAAVMYGSSTAERGSLVGFNLSGNAIGGVAGTNGTNYVADTTDWLNRWVTVGASSAYSDLATANGSTAARLWVNGRKVGDSATTGSSSNTGTTPTLYLGREGQDYNSFFTGDIAWVAIFKRFLTDDEHEWWSERALEVLEQQKNVSFWSLPAAAATSLTVTNATITIAGQTVAMKKVIPAIVTQATMTFSPQAVTLIAPVTVAVTNATMTFSPQAVTLTKVVPLPVTPATVTFAPQQVGALRLTPVSRALITFAPQSVNAYRAVPLTVTPATITFSPQQVGARRATPVSHATITFTTFGVTLNYSAATVAARPGSVAWMQHAMKSRGRRRGRTFTP